MRCPVIDSNIVHIDEAGMRLRFIAIFTTMLCMTATAASPDSRSVSVCTLQRDSQKLLGLEVEVSGILRVGDGHHAFVHDGKCRFLFARGDDYQTFSDRYPIEKDSQWNLMKEAFSKPVCAHLNTRLVKGKFRGTVVRVPATGTRPPNEMPVELVIQSVSEVERVPVQCPIESK
jgi:hypothetical protein